MSKYEEVRRTPAEIAHGVRSCVRQIAAVRELIQVTAISEEFKHPMAVIIEHLQFLEADLQADLDQFREKYGLVPRVLPKGMR